MFVDGREIKNCVRSCERFILSTGYRKKTGRIVSSYRFKSWHTIVNSEAMFSVDWSEIAAQNGTGLLALESPVMPLFGTLASARQLSYKQNPGLIVLVDLPSLKALRET